MSSYAENVRVRYVSHACSKATLFNFTVFVVAVVFPYILCYRAQGFWVKLERIKEQPEVLWKHEVLLLLDARNHDGSQETLVWTTLPGLKSMIRTEMAPYITSREADTNFDSVRDFLEFEITMPLPNKTFIHGLELMLIFEYKLHRYAMVEMESMIYVSKQGGGPGNRFEFVGDMSLVQKEPLWNRHVDKRYNYEVIPRYSSRLEDYMLSNVVSGYAFRNVSTILKNKYDLWFTTPTFDARSKTDFSIKGRVNYVQDTYECWAGFWETLKWAWVQYFSVFVAIYLILKKFQGLVHKARVFDAYLIVPWEKRLGTQPEF